MRGSTLGQGDAVHGHVEALTLKKSLKSLFVLVLLSFAGVESDVYMHNPRGSNDRNCERNVARDNGNRLFNSQNNANGGGLVTVGSIPPQHKEALN